MRRCRLPERDCFCSRRRHIRADCWRIIFVRKLVSTFRDPALAAVCALAFGLWQSVGFAVAQDVPAGDVANGKRLYLSTGCFECHGRSGQGGAFNGPAPIVAKTQLPFEAFKGQLRNPSNDMPAYSQKVMPDQQVADIYAYVQALPGPRPAKSIPILN